MNHIIKRVVFPATFVVMMVAFLSTFILVNPAASFAASTKKNATATPRISAVDYAEVQIKQLQSTLVITTEQEPLWNNLAVVMRENAKDVDALKKENAEDRKSMNAVVRMKMHSQITEAHLHQIKRLIPVFEPFYDSLSDKQKKSVDEIFMTGKYRKHKSKSK